MKKTYSKLWCWLKGHKYIIEVKFSNKVQKLKCTECGKSFGINHDVKSILPWDDELERLHYPVQSKQP